MAACLCVRLRPVLASVARSTVGRVAVGDAWRRLPPHPAYLVLLRPPCQGCEGMAATRRRVQVSEGQAHGLDTSHRCDAGQWMYVRNSTGYWGERSLDRPPLARENRQQ